MKRRLIIGGVALALYVALQTVAWEIGTRNAATSTESHLDYATMDFYHTVAGAIDTMLDHVARTAVRHMGTAESIPLDVVSDIADELDIDEVNVVAHTGKIIASNDPLSLGVEMAGDPVMDEFMQLTNGVAETVSQPFRPHARNPEFRAKYLGAAFPEGNGFVQVGLDERRLAKFLPTLLSYIFDEWVLGRTGFFLCADRNTDVLISNPAHHRGAAKVIGDAGYDKEAARDFEFVLNGKSCGKTFVQRLFGEKCYCRTFLYGGHRFVAALPEREYYSTRTAYVSVFGALLAIVLGAFAIFIDRIFRDADRLKSFYRAEDERRAKDMGVAKTIQTAALPAALPESPCYRLDADMVAARDVGGDFYDHFLLDSTHLAFLVADVSGKGVTAALYMMTAKTLIRDTMLDMGDPAAALTKVNAELCRNNPANMFITVWVGILDFDTGIVTFANAGHNPPVLVADREGGRSAPRLLGEKSGPVLAFAGGITYKPHSVQLEPGDALFLYTDGVTEALDAQNALFGEGRLLETISSAPSADPHDLCTAVRSAVAAFSDGVAQADDITVLSLLYVAKSHTFVRTFQPTQVGISFASEWLDEVLEEEQAGLQASDVSSLHIILDEVCSNVVKHSGASGFKIDMSFSEGKVLMAFSDDGAPYNPLSHAMPDTTREVTERPIGGLGILIVTKIAAAVSYRRAYSRNNLIVEYAYGGFKERK